ncbi:MAG: Yip1 family protein [Pyrinomonadaceae bacterium]
MNDEMDKPADQPEEWQAPPLPEEIIAEVEEPQMSEVETLFGIFMEPGKTFEDLRRKPRFILAFVITALFASVMVIGMQWKLGEERIKSFTISQIEKNPQMASASKAQVEQSAAIGLKIQKVITYLTPLLLLIITAIGALFYWVGSLALGGKGKFGHALSTWVYSSLPPAVVGVILNGIVLLLKNADDIDIATSQRGLIRANLGILVDGKAHPVLATLLGTFDVFAIWGVVLAAIGLRITTKLSSASSWAVVLFLTLIGVAFRVLGAFFNGIPS